MGKIKFGLRWTTPYIKYYNIKVKVIYFVYLKDTEKRKDFFFCVAANNNFKIDRCDIDFILNVYSFNNILLFRHVL